MKTIFITGATDGIGLETAKMLVKKGHILLLHGRNQNKLDGVKAQLLDIEPKATIHLFRVDFSSMAQVKAMAEQVLGTVEHLDVLINNAGVFVAEENQLKTEDCMDVRFAVNTVAPYLLTQKLRGIMDDASRVVNLSSAAQMPVNFTALEAGQVWGHNEAYAQSKLAIILWGLVLAETHPASIIAVNPKSFLGSKMVQIAYGRKGYDLKIGANILCKAALSGRFADANGTYFDNDYNTFASPHPAAKDAKSQTRLLQFMDKWL